MKDLNKDILRLLDANMNRSVEGVRVLEETARILLNDGALTSSIKDIRHSIVHIVKEEKILGRFMIFARDSERDVLRDGETISEQTRTDIISVVHANASRAQEAIRTMEEFVKISFPGISEKFKVIRFKLYDIEKSLVSRIYSRELINKKRLGLYIVIDNEFMEGNDIYEITRGIVGKGAGTIAYLESKLSDLLYLSNAERVLDACRDEDVTMLLFNRLDIAMIVGADGIHMEPDNISVRACRRISGHEFVIGTTVSDLRNPDYEMIDGADYIIVNPVIDNNLGFQDNFKALQQIVSTLPTPVVAMGGITLENLQIVLDSGVAGIAVKPQFSDLSEIYNYWKIIDDYFTKHPDIIKNTCSSGKVY